MNTAGTEEVYSESSWSDEGEILDVTSKEMAEKSYFESKFDDFKRKLDNESAKLKQLAELAKKSWIIKPNTRVLIVGVDHELEGDFFFLRHHGGDYVDVWSQNNDMVVLVPYNLMLPAE